MNVANSSMRSLIHASMVTVALVGSCVSKVERYRRIVALRNDSNRSWNGPVLQPTQHPSGAIQTSLVAILVPRHSVSQELLAYRGVITNDATVLSIRISQVELGLKIGYIGIVD